LPEKKYWVRREVTAGGEEMLTAIHYSSGLRYHEEKEKRYLILIRNSEVGA